MKINLTNDRKRILLSAVIGSTIITLAVVFNKSLGFFDFPIIFSCLAIPFLTRRNINVQESDNKVLNADGEDITKRMNFNFLAIIIGSILASIPIMFLVHTLRKCVGDITIISPSMKIIDFFCTANAWYLLMHIYIFIKNIPFPPFEVEWGYLPTRGYKDYDSIKLNKSSYTSSSNNIITNPGFSSVTGNIYHSRKNH